MAKPMPVLPLVGSIRVAPGFSMPCFSASSIMLEHIRSLTLPPGFRDSSLANMTASNPWVSLLSRIRGVLPIVSNTLFFVFVFIPHITVLCYA